MSPGDRESVLGAANDFVKTLDVSWSDTVPKSLRRQWNSPHESLLNAFAWGHIRASCPEALGVDVRDILEGEGLPGAALRCLDGEDWDSLTSAVAEGAVVAYRGHGDVSATALERLIYWLQDWTEAEEDDLGRLVELVQSMAGADRLKGSVNWIKEGF